MAVWRDITLTKHYLSRFRNGTQRKPVCYRCRGKFAEGMKAWSHVSSSHANQRLYCVLCYEELWH